MLGEVCIKVCKKFAGIFGFWFFVASVLQVKKTNCLIVITQIIMITPIGLAGGIKIGLLIL
jgi:hypothetical protein